MINIYINAWHVVYITVFCLFFYPIYLCLYCYYKELTLLYFVAYIFFVCRSISLLFALIVIVCFFVTRNEIWKCLKKTQLFT